MNFLVVVRRVPGCKLAFAVGVVASFLPGYGGAKGGAELLAHTGTGFLYAFLLVLGTLLSCLVGGLGTAALTGGLDGN